MSGGGPVELHVDDDGFVRVPAPVVYRTLTDVGSWSSFWPRTAVEAHGEDRFSLRVGRGRHRLALDATAGRWRLDTGFVLELAGDLDGTAEFWLERAAGGTVVHHLVHARTGLAAQPTLRAYRAWLRRGLWGLKDELESAARAEQGLPT